MEAIQTRDCCVANLATLRADRSDPSLRNCGLLRMTNRARLGRGYALLESLVSYPQHS
jgi:hypothetical protein